MSFCLFLLIPLPLFLAGHLSAQGQVHVVDDGPFDYGAVWALDLNTDGTIQSQREIGDKTADFTGRLSDRDAFGSAIVSLGDLNGDGTADLAVGAPGDDHGGPDRGAVWILFRAPDGSVASARAIRSGEGLAAPLADQDRFGSALAFLGDLDGDGTVELAVGAPRSPFPAPEIAPGHLRVLSLAADGSVSAERLVGEGNGGFGGDLDAGDYFGASACSMGDLDGNGVADLAVGATGDDDGGSRGGTLWLLFLDADASVGSELKISRTSGGFGSGLGTGIGSSVAPLGDLDGDGVLDLALGQASYPNLGAVWILFLFPDGTVRAKQLIMQAGFPATNSSFGCAVAPLGDLDSDGLPDLAVGAQYTGTGSVTVLFLNADGTLKGYRRLTTQVAGVQTDDSLGAALASLGDLDLDGRADVVFGASRREGAPVSALYSDVQGAVDAAASGDVILVKGGDYGSVAIASTSLTVQGDDPNNVLLGHVQVSGLAPSQHVRLRGLECRLTTYTTAMELQGNEGLIWVEDCRATDDSGPYGSALSVGDCAAVVLIRSRFHASGRQGYPGLWLSGDSALHAYDCTFVGSTGYSGCLDVPCALPGGAGILSTAAGDFAFLSGCTAQGGSGAYDEGYLGGSSCSSGGAGLSMAGQAQVLDSILAGGPGGSNGTSSCAPPGPSYLGNVDFLGGASLAFSASSPAREDEPVTLSFQGPPSAAVYIQGGPNPRAEYQPPLRGSILVGAPRQRVFLGFTDAGGILSVTRSFGLVPAGFEARHFFLQALTIVPFGSVSPGRLHPRSVTLGVGSMLVQLDGAF